MCFIVRTPSIDSDLLYMDLRRQEYKIPTLEKI